MFKKKKKTQEPPPEEVAQVADPSPPSTEDFITMESHNL
jgi:hypothetical protein